MLTLNIIKTILKDSNFHLSLFSDEEIDTLRTSAYTKTVRGKETAFTKCIIRDKEIQLRPEEIVRQLYAARLINPSQYGYKKNRLAFEYSVETPIGVRQACSRNCH